MTRKTIPALTLAAVLSAATGAAPALAAGDGLWLHVRVNEADGAKVTVNLPLSMIDKAIALLPDGQARHLRFDHHGVDADLEDLRQMWREVRSSPDMTFVTVEDDGDKTRVWKEAGTVFVEVRGRDGDEQVDVRLPVAVIDALLAAEELDLHAAVRALVDHGHGDFIEVRDHGDHVRVWVDDESESVVAAAAGE